MTLQPLLFMRLLLLLRNHSCGAQGDPSTYALQIQRSSGLCITASPDAASKHTWRPEAAIDYTLQLHTLRLAPLRKEAQALSLVGPLLAARDKFVVLGWARLRDTKTLCLWKQA